MSDPAPRLPPGFRLLRKLGAGNMGEVFLALSEASGEEVAIKLLPTGGQDTAEAASRFRREAQAQSRVKSPHVVAIHSFEFLADPPFLILEYVPGLVLEAHLQRLPGKRMPFRRVLRLAQELGAGLEALHHAGVLHRDLKPSNVMLRQETEEAVLLDLGLALVTNLTALTATGSLVGTPIYMPPEVLGDTAPWSVRSEVYQLGAMLYECLAGRTMLQAERLEDLFLAALAPERPDLPPSVRVPPGVNEILHQAVEFDPASRFASVAEFVGALEAAGSSRPAKVTTSTSTVLRHSPTRSRRRPGRGVMVAGGVVILSLVAGLGLHQGQRSPTDLHWEVEGSTLVASFLPLRARGIELWVAGNRVVPEQLQEGERTVLVFPGLPPREPVSAQLRWEGGESALTQQRCDPAVVAETFRLRAGRQVEWELRIPLRLHWLGGPIPPSPSPAGPLRLPAPSPERSLEGIGWRTRWVESQRPLSWADLHARALEVTQENPTDQDLEAYLSSWKAGEETPLGGLDREWRDLLDWLPEILRGPLPRSQRIALWNRWQSFQRFQTYEVAAGVQPVLLELPEDGPGGRPRQPPSETTHDSVGPLDQARGAEINLVTPERNGEGSLSNLMGLMGFVFSWPELPASAKEITVGLRMRRWHPTTAVRIRPQGDPQGFHLVLRSLPPGGHPTSNTQWILLRFPRELAPPPKTVMLFEMLPQGKRELHPVFCRDLRFYWPREP